jgi:peroxiredoxin
MAAPPSSAARPVFKAPLAVGDIAPNCVLKTLEGEVVDLRSDAIAGNPLVIVFCPRFSPEVIGALDGFRARREFLGVAGARLFAITLEPGRVAVEQALPFPVLLDRTGETFRAFNANTRDRPTTVVLRPNHHVVALIKEGEEAQSLAALGVVERVACGRIRRC